MIGWYGVPGKPPRDPKVHVVRGGRPVCGTLFSRDAEFQECAAENRAHVADGGMQAVQAQAEYPQRRK